MREKIDEGNVNFHNKKQEPSNNRVNKSKKD